MHPQGISVLPLAPPHITIPLQEEPHVTRYFHLIRKGQKNKTLDCQTCPEIEGEGKQGKEYVAVGALASTMLAEPATDHHIVGSVFPVPATAKLRSHPARGTSFERQNTATLLPCRRTLSPSSGSRRRGPRSDGDRSTRWIS